MPYLIDGHNLIPKLGLRLDSPDDEQELMALLMEFCRLRRAQAEVYFNGATPGQTATRQLGAVTAHFVHRGSSADSAIESRLERLGRSARNWSVVSSDLRLQQAARAVHARAVSSETFAGMMAEAKRELFEKAKDSQGKPSAEEVEAWLAEFKGRPPKS